MWIALTLVFIVLAVVALAFRVQWMGRPVPDENDPTRQSEVSDPTHPHDDPREHDRGRRP